MYEIESSAVLPSLSVVLKMAAVMSLVVTLTPRSKRLSFCLTQMALIMTLSRLPNTGELAGLCKLVSGYSALLVAGAAILHPGGKRNLPLTAAVYPALALCSILLVSGAQDWQFAMAKQVQWLAIVIAGTLTCRCATSDSATLQLLAALGKGLGFGVMAAFSSLIFDPGNSFLGGLGRFTPYGCNPNQIGIAFAATTVLGLYFTTTSKQPALRLGWSLVLLIGFVGVVLAQSRFALGVLALGAAPSLLRMARKPLLMILLVGATTAATTRAISVDDSIQFSRLDSLLDNSRWDWTEVVLDEIRQRPFFGLMTAKNSFSNEEGLNAHNAYIETAYLCGIVYAIPNAVLVLYSLACTAWCGLAPEKSRFSTYTLHLVCALQICTVVSGAVNNIIYYPTYTWAFLHVMLSQLVLAERYANSRIAAEQPSAVRTAGTTLGRTLAGQWATSARR